MITKHASATLKANQSECPDWNAEALAPSEKIEAIIIQSHEKQAFRYLLCPAPYKDFVVDLNMLGVPAYFWIDQRKLFVWPKPEVDYKVEIRTSVFPAYFQAPSP